MFSIIHETYRSYWNHHQKHACEIWGSLEKLQFLTEKCLQRRTFKIGWNFDFFSMFSKIHETYRIYWNHHQKHACKIWGGPEKLQFLMEKCLQRRTFKTGWNFDIFSMFSKIHDTCIIYWNHHQKHACEIWGSLEKLQFLTEKCLQRRPLKNRMKFRHFHNVLHNSWNLQKLLESPPETCMWNLRQYGEVTIFDGKCRQRQTFKTRWNFDIFSMFSKIHETYRIRWNHHQKHACEIWGSLEKFQFLTEKCLQRRPFKIGWNFDIFSMFSKIHETYRSYWNHHQKHACEIWDSLEKLQFLTEKCLQRRTLKTGWNFDIFSMFSKIHETYRSFWNHHQKHACEIWGSLEKLQFLTEKCLQRRTFKIGWNFDIFSMFSKIHDTYRIYWNHHQKHACKFEAVWRATIFDRKMPTVPDLQNRMKFWDFLNVLQNSWNLQKLLESPPETCMWNLRQFGEVTIFDGKCLQRRTFKTGWNFDFFSMFSKIHETYRIYWNHHQKHACEIWGSLEKSQFLTEKCLQHRTFKTGWILDIFSMFSIIHETYRSYWNHHQKHACEIWGSLEKSQFLTEKCLQRRPLKTGWNLDIFSMFSIIHETYRSYWNHHQKHACEIWGS